MSFHIFHPIRVQRIMVKNSTARYEGVTAMGSRSKTGLGIAEIIGQKRDRILELADKHGAYNVRIFGSVARGEATPDSDIDLLVEWDFTRISPWGGAGLDIELQELLRRSVDVVTIEDLHPLMRASVLKEAIAL